MLSKAVRRLFYFVSVLAVCGLLIRLAAQQAPGAPPPSAPSQEAPPPGQPTIRVQVNEVIVPVTVTDDKGRFVSNLTANEFRVLDEGRPQRIQFFSHTEKQPIVVGFLVDLSNASRIHWKTYSEAIKTLIWQLLPGDKRFAGYLISYNNEAELVVNTTSDGDKLTEQIDRMKPGGGAALYDAIYMACTRRELVKGEPYEPRRVIVVIGDGHDNASSRSLEQVLELAQRQLVTIYGMSTASFGFTDPSADVLKRLAEQTGGNVEYPLNSLYKDISGYISKPKEAGNYVYEVGSGGYASAIAKGIADAVGSIDGDITTQYILRYTPDVDAEAAGRVFRRIKVEIPSLPNVTIRAREGYYPEPVNAAPVANP